MVGVANYSNGKSDGTYQSSYGPMSNDRALAIFSSTLDYLSLTNDTITLVNRFTYTGMSARGIIFNPVHIDFAVLTDATLGACLVQIVNETIVQATNFTATGSSTGKNQQSIWHPDGSRFVTVSNQLICTFNASFSPPSVTKYNCITP